MHSRKGTLGDGEGSGDEEIESESELSSDVELTEKEEDAEPPVHAPQNTGAGGGAGGGVGGGAGGGGVGASGVAKKATAQESVQDSILAALRGVGSTGAFATSGVLLELPPFTPAVTVHGVGRLGLPLCEAQGKQLYSSGAPAPHGLGQKTLLDPKVRSAKQYEAADITLAKPWAAVLQIIVKQACTGLGIEVEGGTTVRAELHKLLVYEKGDHFLTHRDSEKGPGMFGSLLIALPSAHQGGVLTVRHGPGTVAIDFGGKSSVDELRWAAFFADCAHELAPIAEGRRVVLAYNLFSGHVVGKGSKGVSDICAPAIPSAAPAALLSAAVKRWQKSGENPPYLMLPLEHRYTEANLNFETLKRHDKDVVNILEGCRELEVHLVLVRLHVSGDVENDDYDRGRHKRSRWCAYDEDSDDDDDGEGKVISEEHERETNIAVWVHGENSTVELEKFVDLEDETVLLSDDPLFDEDGDVSADEREYEGFMGNYGPSLQLTYYKAAAVFFPRIHALPLLRKAGWGPLAAATLRLAAAVGWNRPIVAPYLEALAKATGVPPTSALAVIENAMRSSSGEARVAEVGAHAITSCLRSAPEKLSEKDFSLVQRMLKLLPTLANVNAAPLKALLEHPSVVSVRFPDTVAALIKYAPASLQAALLESKVRGEIAGIGKTVGGAHSDTCSVAATHTLWSSEGLTLDSRPALVELFLTSLRTAGEGRLRTLLALPEITAALATGDATALRLRALYDVSRVNHIAASASATPDEALRLLSTIDVSVREAAARALLTAALPINGTPLWTAAARPVPLSLFVALWRSGGAAALAPLPQAEIVAARGRAASILLNLARADRASVTAGRGVDLLLAALGSGSAPCARGAAAAGDASAVELVRERIAWLEKRFGAAGAPPTSDLAWTWPSLPRGGGGIWPVVAMPTAPDVERWMRSPLQRLQLGPRRFKGLPEARKFGTLFRSLESSGMLSVGLSGKGGDVIIVLQKSNSAMARELASLVKIHTTAADKRKALLKELSTPPPPPPPDAEGDGVIVID